jgi:cell division protein FtsZ
MKDQGLALMGTGRATGDKRALEAAHNAISSPLLEDIAIDGATGILINITGGANLTLVEVNAAASLIQEAADDDANIIFGAVIDEAMGDEIKMTVIATGFERVQRRQPAPAPSLPAGLRELRDVQVGPRVGWDDVRPSPAVALAPSSKVVPRALDPIILPAIEDGGHDLDIPTFLRREAAK